MTALFENSRRSTALLAQLIALINFLTESESIGHCEIEPCMSICRIYFPNDIVVVAACLSNLAPFPAIPSEKIDGRGSYGPVGVAPTGRELIAASIVCPFAEF